MTVANSWFLTVALTRASAVHHGTPRRTFLCPFELSSCKRASGLPPLYHRFSLLSVHSSLERGKVKSLRNHAVARHDGAELVRLRPCNSTNVMRFHPHGHSQNPCIRISCCYKLVRNYMGCCSSIIVETSRAPSEVSVGDSHKTFTADANHHGYYF